VRYILQALSLSHEGLSSAVTARGLVRKRWPGGDSRAHMVLRFRRLADGGRQLPTHGSPRVASADSPYRRLSTLVAIRGLVSKWARRGAYGCYLAGFRLACFALRSTAYVVANCWACRRSSLWADDLGPTFPCSSVARCRSAGGGSRSIGGRPTATCAYQLSLSRRAAAYPLEAWRSAESVLRRA